MTSNDLLNKAIKERSSKLYAYKFLARISTNVCSSQEVEGGTNVFIPVCDCRKSFIGEFKAVLKTLDSKIYPEYTHTQEHVVGDQSFSERLFVTDFPYENYLIIEDLITSEKYNMGEREAYEEEMDSFISSKAN